MDRTTPNKLPDSIAEVWSLWAAALDDLYARGLIRSTGRAVADYAESLAFRALDGEAWLPRGAGGDFRAKTGLLYEVKGLRPGQTDNPRRFVSVSTRRPLPFDFLVAVFFTPSMVVRRASLVPARIVEGYAGSRGSLTLNEDLLGQPDAEDITEQVLAVQRHQDRLWPRA